MKVQAIHVPSTSSNRHKIKACIGLFQIWYSWITMTASHMAWRVNSDTWCIELCHQNIKYIDDIWLLNWYWTNRQRPHAVSLGPFSQIDRKAKCIISEHSKCFYRRNIRSSTRRVHSHWLSRQSNVSLDPTNCVQDLKQSSFRST